MSHSTDDRDGAEERIPEGVPLDRLAPGVAPADAENTDWTTDATANGWSGTEVHYASTGDRPVHRPDPLTDPLPEFGPVGGSPAPPPTAQPQWDPQPPPTAQPQWDPQPAPPRQWDQPEQAPEHAQLAPAQPQQWDQPAPPPQHWQNAYPQQQPAAAPAPQHYAPTYARTQPAAPPPVAPPLAAAPPPPPAVSPRPEDLLERTLSPIVTQPASWGWRGRVNRATGGLVKAKAAAAELEVRQAIHDIQRSFSRPMTVVVVQPKGGAGKTPTTICLSAAFGANRGGYVVGWDDNETRGTLAVRVTNPDSKNTTVWDLLGDLSAFERFDARVGDLSHYVRSQPDAHFDALVSDDNPGNMSQIGEEEYQRLHKVLQRFYRMIVVDTGNNVRSPNWQAAVNSADLVVVVSSYQRDVGYSGSWVLDHLAQTGREELARNAVTVLTAADPTVDKTVRTQLLEHFTARTRAVIEIPYDQGLAHGGPIRWNDLAMPTRNAWIQAGATIANCLSEHDQRAMAERRA